MKTTGNPVVDKSKRFAIASVRLYQKLTTENRVFILSKQFVRCATSIGANVHEAIRAQSKADFAAKIAIALKEAQETEYWLDLLHDTGYISDSTFVSANGKNQELLRLLMSISKSAAPRSNAQRAMRNAQFPDDIDN